MKLEITTFYFAIGMKANLGEDPYAPCCSSLNIFPDFLIDNHFFDDCNKLKFCYQAHYAKQRDTSQTSNYHKLRNTKLILNTSATHYSLFASLVTLTFDSIRYAQCKPQLQLISLLTKDLLLHFDRLAVGANIFILIYCLNESTYSKPMHTVDYHF